ncbi:RNA methyltransferase [Sphingobacteriales bacterium UPWRP_1]|nr:hypothetical protein B6N25_15120 [Sphingobacteriales bacterium TSM_CSS]PSJ78755.1 RNA methyltransferase [Sphingobacteriales bacterium UPWRP_1]
MAKLCKVTRLPAAYARKTKDSTALMISKQQIKFIQSLKIKKYRQQYRAFIAEGEKIVPEMLQSSVPVLGLYALPDWIQQHTALLKRHNCLHIVQEITDGELNKISSLETPNCVLAIGSIAPQLPDDTVLQQQLCLVLDDIKDPGNLGTIIRTADWFGIPYVFCSPECVDVFNPKVVQSAMGSLFRVKVFYQPLPSLLQNYRHGPVFGALLNGLNAYTTPIQAPALLVVGSESHGISGEVLPHIQQAITIPRRGGAESLNAAVATGILCALALRR